MYYNSATRVGLVYSTYYASFDERLPGSFPADDAESMKRSRAVTYYQWVPFILLSQEPCCHRSIVVNGDQWWSVVASGGQ